MNLGWGVPRYILRNLMSRHIGNNYLPTISQKDDQFFRCYGPRCRSMEMATSTQSVSEDYGLMGNFMYYGWWCFILLGGSPPQGLWVSRLCQPSRSLVASDNLRAISYCNDNDPSIQIFSHTQMYNNKPNMPSSQFYSIIRWTTNSYKQSQALSSSNLRYIHIHTL